MSSKDSKQLKLHGAVAQNQNNPFLVFPQSFDFTNLRLQNFLVKNFVWSSAGHPLGRENQYYRLFEKIGKI